MNRRIYLAGAHGGYRSLKAPLGGGATIFEALIEAWRTQPHVDLKILAPGPEYTELHAHLYSKSNWALKLLKRSHPAGLGYLSYARFCRLFEKAVTDYLLAQPLSDRGWVICNDLSEGPSVQELKKAHYGVITLVHVDVLEFVSQVYLRGRIQSSRLAKFWRGLRSKRRTRFVPDLIRLIFDKQEEAYLHSDWIVVPSTPMKKVIMECYPELDSRKVVVIPWGHPALEAPEPPTDERMKRWSLGLEIARKDFVILTLSRISPEKGIDRLLEALSHLDRFHPDVAAKCCCVVAGHAAYMDGKRYLRKLKAMARRLHHVRVRFAGHLTGVDKACAFARANWYAFLSRHESYGLTLVEALEAGVPAVVSQEVAKRLEMEQGVMVTDSDPEHLSELIVDVVEGRIDIGEPLEHQIFFRHAADQILSLIQHRTSLTG